MADLGFEVSAGVQRAALVPTGLTPECAGGQPRFAPEVMMSRPSRSMEDTFASMEKDPVFRNGLVTATLYPNRIAGKRKG
jgi:hypothetical protein